MVVPYAAGGPIDTLARILAARLSEILGQQVVIENMPGAGGMTGASRVAKSAPDGYTVLLSGSAVLALNQTLYKKPLYNAVTDFEHVALFSDSARAKAVNEAVETPAVRERYKSIGVTIPPSERRTPEYLAKFVPSEIERWAAPIKASGASAE